MRYLFCALMVICVAGHAQTVNHRKTIEIYKTNDLSIDRTIFYLNSHADTLYYLSFRNLEYRELIDMSRTRMNKQELWRFCNTFILLSDKDNPPNESSVTLNTGLMIFKEKSYGVIGFRIVDQDRKYSGFTLRKAKMLIGTLLAELNQ